MSVEATDLKPNQIRCHVNQKGSRNYYMIVAVGGAPEASRIVWFRSSPDEPMYLSSQIHELKWDLTKDEVLVENMNAMRDALENSRSITPLVQSIIDIYNTNYANRKVEAIKHYRSETGMGLKIAKTEVENIEVLYGLV